MRKRIGSRGFKNYSKSYQKKLLTRLRKEINKNYEALHKKLMLQDNSRDESLFSQSLYDINQTLKVLGKRIERGTLTYEQRYLMLILTLFKQVVIQYFKIE